MRGLRRLGLVVFCGLYIVHAQSTQTPPTEIENALQAGDPQRALSLADAALRDSRNDPRLLHLRGLAYFRLAKLDDAQHDLALARKLAPTDLDVAFDLGLVYMAQSRYEQAATQFEVSLKDQERQRSGLPHLLLGRAYQNSNRSELAIREFQTALKHEPNLKMGHFHLGYAYESVGRNQEALAEYEQELKQPQAGVEVLYQYGHLLLEMGSLERAEATLRQALRTQRSHADAQYDLGKTLLSQHRFAEAAIELRRAVELQPESASAYFQLGKALAKTGDVEGARQANQRFAELKAAQRQQGGMATGRVR